MINPDELERLARAAYHDYALADIAVGGGMKATVSVPAFIAAANPATILALLSANREMREALLNIDACSQHSYGFSDFSMRRRCGQIARSALTTQRGGE